jgi:hypothetical protein
VAQSFGAQQDNSIPIRSTLELPCQICGCPIRRLEAVKKPKLGNGFKNFSQLEALQAIIRTSVYILHHPKNPTNHWQIGFFTDSWRQVGFLLL